VSRLITIILACAFLALPSFAVDASAESESSYHGWMEAHRVRVNVQEAYAYRDGILTIEIFYTGTDLKGSPGNRAVRKRNELAVQAEELAGYCRQVGLDEQEVLGLLDGKTITRDGGSKVTVLTAAEDPPQWWEDYAYPQWAWLQTDSGYEISDPINLAWENTDKAGVKAALDGLDWENDWVDNGLLESIGALHEFVYLKDQGWTLGDNYATDSLGLTGREHMRLWTIHTGAVVAAAHVDSAAPHKAIAFEGEEDRVKGIFDASPGWSPGTEAWLDNVVSDPGNPPYCDGYAAVIVRSAINNPPHVPSTPSGPGSGYAGISYSYSTAGSDPDGDQVKYSFDWGDGSSSETGFVNSGTSAYGSHSWGSPGSYHVGARATDSRGDPSGWSSTLLVTISIPINNPPETPSDPSPADGAAGFSIDSELSWTGGDPDAGDTVTYDVYFGGSANLTEKESMGPYPATQSSISYDPGTLSYNTKYYWYIVATDSHGIATASPLWDFSTGAPTNNPPNTPSKPSPLNHAAGVSLGTDLSWTGGDPDAGDTVSYDIYFGSSANLTEKESIGPYPANQSSISYDPAGLSYNTTYYWKIVAKDNHEVIREGPLWDFTTSGPGPALGWNLPWGLDADPSAVNIWTYPADAAPVTLLDVNSTMPEGLLIWHYGGPVDGWQFYKKGWGTVNTLASLVPGGGYIAIVPAAGVWQIPQG
jgi:hypothetical protein